MILNRFSFRFGPLRLLELGLRSLLTPGVMSRNRHLYSIDGRKQKTCICILYIPVSTETTYAKDKINKNKYRQYDVIVNLLNYIINLCRVVEIIIKKYHRYFNEWHQLCLLLYNASACIKPKHQCSLVFSTIAVYGNHKKHGYCQNHTAMSIHPVVPNLNLIWQTRSTNTLHVHAEISTTIRPKAIKLLYLREFIHAYMYSLLYTVL